MAEARPVAPLDDRGNVDMSAFGPQESSGNLPAVIPQPGHTVVNFQHGIITAQRVAVRRDYKTLEQRLRTLSAMAGSERYIYSWEVNDHQSKRKVTIEGPTIKLADDLLREFGNCLVDVKIDDNDDHWMIYARFVDLESGTSQTRPFRQRKLQTAGRMDADRQLDLAMQIGVSKAIRNVVVHCLAFFTEIMMEEATNNLLAWVDNSPEKAREFITRIASEFNIEMKRIEATVGVSLDKMTTRSLAKIMKELRGVKEGWTDGDRLYPKPEDIEAVEENRAAREARSRNTGDGADDSNTEADQEAAQKKAAAAAKRKKKAAEKKADEDAAKQEAAEKKQEAAEKSGADPETGEMPAIPAALDRRGDAPAKDDGGETQQELPVAQQQSPEETQPDPVEQPGEPEPDPVRTGNEDFDSLDGFE